MSAPIRWLLALSCAAHAAPGTSLLTLVPPNVATKVNAIEIKVRPQNNISLEDTETALLTGTVLADIEVDVLGDDPVELSFRNGRGTISDMNFAKTAGFTSYNAQFRNLSFAITTPNPPGIVNVPPSGTFDASQHNFLVDQGTATGQFQILFVTTPINQTFTPASPLGGPANGSGTLTLTRTGIRPGFIDYAVTLNFPVNIDQTQGTPPQDVRVFANGTIRATGTLSVSDSGYLQWTLEQNVRGEPYTGDLNEDGVSNGLAWALGLNAWDEARPHLPRVLANRSYLLPLPAGGSGAPLRLMVSDSLGQWNPVATSRISSGQNPLPAGTAGDITIAPGGATREYFRIEAVD